MAKITVVVPVSSDVESIKDWKGEIVGIPFLGEARRYIMNEEEFQDWIDMWKADKSLGRMFYVERHAR